MGSDPAPDSEAIRAASNEREPILAAFLNPFGRLGIQLNNILGAMAIFLVRACIQIFNYKQIPEIINQIYFIGAKSASIVALVGFFTGMVLGLQLYYVMNKFGAVGFLGTAVSLSLIRELGPVLTAIMITARAGSAMTAEIGIQRISEQIDALTTMRIDPLGYLISPRIAAALVSFPILTAFFDLIGILGGYLSGVILMGANAGAYTYRIDASLEWLDVRGWIELPASVDELVYRLTEAGLEVEEILRTGPDLSGVRVGHVLERARHPDADRLSVCRVDLGEGEPLEVVCGAPNVAVGQKVAVAVAGTELPGGLRIKKSKIRGVVSNGMICSTRELGLGDDTDGILVLDPGAPVGVALPSVLPTGETVLDVEITPNRGDWVSLLGMAREVRASFGGTRRLPETQQPEAGAPAEAAIRISVGDRAGCARYVGRVVRGVRVGPSEPAKLVGRIDRALHDARGAENATGGSAWLSTAHRTAAGRVTPRRPRR